MLITVDRYISDADATVSRVSVDGQFVCFGLEDQYQAGGKVDGKTRIPAGTYKIGVRKEGGFHQNYSSRFAGMHRGMLHVQDVPGFEYILIHVGNTDEDTKGCLLVGMNAGEQPGSLRVNSSANAYKLLYPMVIEAAENGDLHIEYQDNDRPSV